MGIAILPRALVARLASTYEARLHTNVLLSACVVLSLASLLANYPALSAFLPHVCLVNVLFHVPCPGCGVTRGIAAFLVGDLRGAWGFNPAAPLVCIVVMLEAPLRGLALLRPVASSVVITICNFLANSALAALMVSWLVRIL